MIVQHIVTALLLLLTKRIHSHRLRPSRPIHCVLQCRESRVVKVVNGVVIGGLKGDITTTIDVNVSQRDITLIIARLYDD